MPKARRGAWKSSDSEETGAVLEYKKRSRVRPKTAGASLSSEKTAGSGLSRLDEEELQVSECLHLLRLSPPVGFMYIALVLEFLNLPHINHRFRPHGNTF